MLFVHPLWNEFQNSVHLSSREKKPKNKQKTQKTNHTLRIKLLKHTDKYRMILLYLPKEVAEN